MIKNHAILLSLVIILSGCSVYHVSSEDATDDYHPSKRLAAEIVYLETPDRPHDVIGRVIVNTERRQNMNEVLDKMKREAAIIGGDAITNIQSDATGNWKKLPAQEIIGNAYVRANFSASVVVFK